MRATIILSVATAMFACAAIAQPTPGHSATAPRPQKCAYHHRLVLVGACSSTKPWKCEPCPHGVRSLRRLDNCGVPVEVCAPA